jgi:hypothetical protein
LPTFLFSKRKVGALLKDINYNNIVAFIRRKGNGYGACGPLRGGVDEITNTEEQ